MIRSNAILFMALAMITLLHSTTAFSKTEVEETFKKFDVPEENEPDCEDDDFDEAVCPKDETIPCGTVDQIFKYCSELLGPDVTRSSIGIGRDSGKNPLEGCVKYIGFHVLDLDHMACCPSETCEDWIDEQFEMMNFEEEGGYYDDDDDDDEYDEF
jgi:hypothetical protein